MMNEEKYEAARQRRPTRLWRYDDLPAGAVVAGDHELVAIDDGEI